MFYQIYNEVHVPLLVTKNFLEGRGKKMINKSI